jgi:hypothetical protein
MQSRTSIPPPPVYKPTSGPLPSTNLNGQIRGVPSIPFGLQGLPVRPMIGNQRPADDSRVPNSHTIPIVGMPKNMGIIRPQSPKDRTAIIMNGTIINSEVTGAPPQHILTFPATPAVGSAPIPPLNPSSPTVDPLRFDSVTKISQTPIVRARSPVTRTPPPPSVLQIEGLSPSPSVVTSPYIPRTAQYLQEIGIPVASIPSPTSLPIQTVLPPPPQLQISPHMTVPSIVNKQSPPTMVSVIPKSSISRMSPMPPSVAPVRPSPPQQVPLMLRQSPPVAPSMPQVTRQSPVAPQVTPSMPQVTRQSPVAPPVASALMLRQSPSMQPQVTRQSPVPPQVTRQSPVPPQVTRQSPVPPQVTRQSPVPPIVNGTSPIPPITAPIPVQEYISTTPTLTNGIFQIQSRHTPSLPITPRVTAVTSPTLSPSRLNAAPMSARDIPVRIPSPQNQDMHIGTVDNQTPPLRASSPILLRNPNDIQRVQSPLMPIGPTPRSQAPLGPIGSPLVQQLPPPVQISTATMENLSTRFENSIPVRDNNLSALQQPVLTMSNQINTSLSSMPRMPQRPDYVNMDMAMQNEMHIQFRVKFGTIRSNYPQYNIQEPPETSSLDVKHNWYESYVRQIVIAMNSNQWMMYLFIALLAIEVIGIKVLHLNFSGFLKSQLRIMGRYQTLLVELGEKYYTGSGSSWSVESKIAFLCLGNAVVFIVVRYLASHLGENVATGIHAAFDQLMGSGSISPETLGIAAPTVANSGGPPPINPSAVPPPAAASQPAQPGAPAGANPLSGIMSAFGSMFAGNGAGGGADMLGNIVTSLTSALGGNNAAPAAAARGPVFSE